MKKNRIRSKTARAFLFLLLCNQCYFLQLSGFAIPWPVAIEMLSSVARTGAILSVIFVGKKVATIELDKLMVEISASDEFAYQSVVLKQLEQFKPRPWALEKTNNGCRLSSPDRSLTIGIEFKAVSELELNVSRAYEEYLAQ